ncbi:PREDICTED: uncharacterized protein LOC109183336 [Ipomoea nil]|uniref:uncharacterized protein LOC109183336 n=1 Tax=Ipomoea nil TaxID=35883 RepID=UPI000900CE9C|nr:PREDICTED: uncharacterized protein LOC109183336 [Ipomoea nil]
MEPRISGASTNKVCKKFGFENWIRVEVVGFNGGIWLLWRNDLSIETIAINPQFILTKERYTRWNKNSFGSIERRKKCLNDRIEGVQRCMDSHPYNGLINLDKKLRSELEDTLYQDELNWFQKSKEDYWIASGDLNTKYYHASTMVCHSRNKIHGPMDSNGVWVLDKSHLEELVQGFYVNLYSRDNVVDLTVASLGAFPAINEGQINGLNKLISKEEVKEALWAIAPIYEGTRPGWFSRNVLSKILGYGGILPT